MLKSLKSLKFYTKYYLTNHVIAHIPIHGLRLFWYRRCMKIRIGARSQIWLGCRFFGDAIAQIEIGSDTVLGYGVTLNAAAPIRIEDHVLIAAGSMVHTADHDCQDPNFSVRTAPVTIQSQAYIASNALILKGVTLGEGAVVAAGSVVFQDVKPLAIVAGNPARAVGSRVKGNPPQPILEAPLFC